MLTLLLSIGGLVAAYFVVTFGLHLFRMRTDPYYRFKAQEAEQEHQMRQNLRQLQNSDSAAVREIAKKLGAPE